MQEMSPASLLTLLLIDFLKAKFYKNFKRSDWLRGRVGISAKSVIGEDVDRGFAKGVTGGEAKWRFAKSVIGGVGICCRCDWLRGSMVICRWSDWQRGRWGWLL